MKEHCGDSVDTRSTMFVPVSNQSQGMQLPQPPGWEIASPLPSNPQCHPVLGLQKGRNIWAVIWMSQCQNNIELQSWNNTKESTGPSTHFGPRDPFLLKQSKGKSESERWAKSELFNCCFTCDGCCLKQDVFFLNLNKSFVICQLQLFAWFLKLTCYDNFLYSLI